MIAGIGASAGGLEAFVQVLNSVPPDAGLALVVIQHLAPKQKSSLPALLAPHTKMPVVETTNGVRLVANHVYVMPPNVQIELVDGRLKVAPRPADRTQHMPIDVFFSSLAVSARERGVAVVLSGTASDGSLGLRDIKAAGGITIAQTPESAKQDGMPRAAIGTGMVDLVMTPAEIGIELGRIARHSHGPADSGDQPAPSDDELRPIFDLLRPVSGVDFRHYKTPTIRRRLLRRMALHRITDLDTYLALLRSNPAELRALFEDLLIHVTRFFREPESFEALARDVFPDLVNNLAPDEPIRLWVCGCATGEEAYSIAIALVEFLQRAERDARVQIFATDVSDTAIEHARAAVYPASIAADVGPERLRRFFVRTEGNYRVSKLIRDLCVFARQDLTKDPPFSRIDLVMCRNVLIYMDAMLQKKLIALFHYALRPDGFLMLGQAETIGAHTALFSLTDKKHRVHRKKDVPGATPAMRRPVAAQTAAAIAGPDAELEKLPAERKLLSEVNRLILDRYAPAGIVVDNELQIVQFRGQTGAYLEPAPGEASLNLLKMAREGLLYGLRSALQTARKTNAPVRKAGLQVRTGNGTMPVAVEVVPLTTHGRPHYLVLFDSSSQPADTAVKDRRRTRPAVERDDTTSALRRELAASREYMQSIIQELEAANEELQSANEEILSSNEELQSTNEELDTAKEELQSTNEELQTLNDELQSRNEEIGRVNSDLLNLIASVQIAIVIVTGELRIRRFTPMAEKVLNLIPSDHDRSIAHINPNIDCPNLEQLITECIDSVTPVEREVQDRQGRWYALRIRPYKSLDNKIDGAVLALFDIDILKKSERLARLAESHAEAVILGAPVPMALADHDLKVRLANDSFARLLGSTSEASRGRLLSELGGDQWRLDGWAAPADRRLGSRLPPVTIHRRNGTAFVVHGHFVPALNSGELLIMVTIIEERDQGA